MILHLMLNSLIVFLGLAFFVEIILLCFKIKNARVRYVCRSLPFLKIIFDLFIFILAGKSLFFNLNPCSCEIYVFEMLSKFFPLKMGDLTKHLVLPHYLYSQLTTFGKHLLTTTVLAVMFLGLSRQFYHLFQEKKYLKNLLKNAQVFTFDIANFQLKKNLKKRRLLISSEIEIPFATYRHIVIPSHSLKLLNQNELEAVIAHELQHIRWKDPLIKFSYSIIASLCWWLPTKWLLKKITADQEEGSDAAIKFYDIKNYDLASAMSKILQNAKEVKKQAICFLGTKSTHMQRLESLLESKKNRPITCMLTLSLSIICFMCFWMC